MIKKQDKKSNTTSVVSCFCENKSGKHLILKRTKTVFMPERWGPPAGKVESGENLKEAIVREVFEETGIDITDNDLIYFGSYSVSIEDKSFDYYVFKTSVDSHEVRLCEREHQAFEWVTPEEALEFPLIHHQDQVVRDFYGIN